MKRTIFSAHLNFFALLCKTLLSPLHNKYSIKCNAKLYFVRYQFLNVQYSNTTAEKCSGKVAVLWTPVWLTCTMHWKHLVTFDRFPNLSQGWGGSLWIVCSREKSSLNFLLFINIYVLILVLQMCWYYLLLDTCFRIHCYIVQYFKILFYFKFSCW